YLTLQRRQAIAWSIPTSSLVRSPGAIVRLSLSRRLINKRLPFGGGELAPPPNERSSVYQRKTSEYALNATRQVPPSLQQLRWSREGRYVEFRSANETNGVDEHVLDLDTRALKEPPASIRMLGWVKENTVRISSNGHYEARINEGKLVVFRTELSTNV